MKKKTFFNTACIIVSLLLLSCGIMSCNNDDDDVKPNYSASLIGKWQVTIDENPDAYVVTFNPDKTAFIEQYKDYKANGMSKKAEECRVTWNVSKDKLVFEGGKAWFAFGYARVTLVSVTKNSIVGSQWLEDSNVHFTRM